LSNRAYRARGEGSRTALTPNSSPLLYERGAGHALRTLSRSARERVARQGRVRAVATVNRATKRNGSLTLAHGKLAHRSLRSACVAGFAYQMKASC
jgi:hypothetical protein